MACYDPPRTEKELNRFDDMSKRQFEAVLCGCMRAGMPLDAVDWDEVGVDRGLVERWWKCHQEEDAARAAKGDQRLRAITAMHNTILCDALDAERAENERLRAMIRVNAIRYLNMSHEDIDAAIRAALSSTGEKG